MENKSLIVGYYYFKKDADDFLKEIKELNLFKNNKGKFINLINGQKIVLLSIDEKFNSLRSYNDKTIVMLTTFTDFERRLNGIDRNFLKKEERRLNRLSNKIWGNRNDFLGSIISNIYNQIELERLIKEIQEEI